ncbi:uncharacterized protein LOC131317380 [Rhododendron vialii]|uniref:uncharacterized protein LOC131317380 n=1 Tax=Rhododendron vialii TaxID=182163 RepID=UPI0026605107|nr:uncharacterized protein LOC131317380 [Rhododendron vialii]
MKRDVVVFVSKCLTCQQVKAEHQRPVRELEPFPVTEWKWEKVTVDFVTGLPRALRGHDAIWVTNSIDTLSHLYIREIIRLHGILVSIVLDQDPRFIARFWQRLQAALGTNLLFSTTYHPQTDGLSERTIQILEDMLRSRQKSYADCRRRPLSFEVGDHVFLKVSLRRGLSRFGQKGKLSPRFIGPFDIIEKIREVAYQLALPPRLSGIHDVFHVSMLRREKVASSRYPKAKIWLLVKGLLDAIHYKNHDVIKLLEKHGAKPLMAPMHVKNARQVPEYETYPKELDFTDSIEITKVVYVADRE